MMAILVRSTMLGLALILSPCGCGPHAPHAGGASRSNFGLGGAALPPVELANGTRMVAIKLSSGKALPEGAVPGAAVDILGETRDPIRTGVAIINVVLLAVDPGPVLKDQSYAVSAQLTPVQEDVVALMRKHNMEIVIKVHVGDSHK